jgi:hypothetical protein
MAGFTFKLELADGTPADPPSFRAAVPSWRPGDTINLPQRRLRVVRVRDDDAADQPPSLVVQDVLGDIEPESCRGYLSRAAATACSEAMARV